MFVFPREHLRNVDGVGVIGEVDCQFDNLLRELFHGLFGLLNCDRAGRPGPDGSHRHAAEAPFRALVTGSHRQFDVDESPPVHDPTAEFQRGTERCWLEGTTGLEDGDIGRLGHGEQRRAVRIVGPGDTRSRGDVSGRKKGKQEQEARTTGWGLPPSGSGREDLGVDDVLGTFPPKYRGDLSGHPGPQFDQRLGRDERGMGSDHHPLIPKQGL